MFYVKVKRVKIYSVELILRSFTEELRVKTSGLPLWMPCHSFTWQITRSQLGTRARSLEKCALRIYADTVFNMFWPTVLVLFNVN